MSYEDTAERQIERLHDRVAALEATIADALADIHGVMNGLGDPHDACDFDGDTIAALRRTIHDGYDALKQAVARLSGVPKVPVDSTGVSGQPVHSCNGGT